MKKKDSNKIYFAVILVVALLAMVATVVFGVMYDKDAGIDSPANGTANTFFNIAYWITAVFIFAGIILAVCFALFHLVKLFVENPKKGLSTIVPFGMAIVLYIVAYIISSPNDISNDKLILSNTSESTSKMIGSGLIVTYILMGIALLAAVYTEVAKKFK